MRLKNRVSVVTATASRIAKEIAILISHGWFMQ
jgi:hypothetical protein